MTKNVFNIVHKEIVSSTMDEIKYFPTSTLLFVDKQTKGRGKGDRNWISENNLNLYMSLSIDASDNNINYSNLSFLTSVCVLETINYLTHNKLNVQTKWPNDVLVNQKKACGILLEFDLKNKTLIIGIGLNLVSHPNNVLFESTDIRSEGFEITRKDFIDYFLDRFNYYLEDLKINGFQKIHDIWLNNSFNYKKSVIVKNNIKQDIVGVFESFNLDGTITLKKNNEKLIEITSGDIFNF